jgi:hypothetical protein
MERHLQTGPSSPTSINEDTTMSQLSESHKEFYEEMRKTFAELPTRLSRSEMQMLDTANLISALARWRKAERKYYARAPKSKPRSIQNSADEETARIELFEVTDAAWGWLCKVIEELAGPAPCCAILPDHTVLTLVDDPHDLFDDRWAALQIIPGDRVRLMHEIVETVPDRPVEANSIA